MINDPTDPKNISSTSLWITSLAVSVVFCAFFFLIFTAQLLDVKKSLAIVEIRFETLDNRISGLTNDVTELRRQLMALQTQATTTGAAVMPQAQIPTTGQVTVIRGQLPANASINNQPLNTQIITDPAVTLAPPAQAPAGVSDAPKIALPTVSAPSVVPNPVVQPPVPTPSVKP